MKPVWRAALDPSLHARVVARAPLLLEGGADPATDRPPHVRAASALAAFGGHVWIVQDDALWLAALDGDRARAVALPAAADGIRLFDEGRGNKAAKPDFEACAVLPFDDGPRLALFGSGSTSRRERIALLDRGGRIDVVEATSLYARLRAEASFAGSEMNVEGAVVRGEDLVLFSRGNGAPRGDLLPIDATATFSVADIVAYLARGATGPVPPLRAVDVYTLGEVEGVRLTFTDAARVGDDLVYVAAAEASPNAYHDGPVAGVALGLLAPVPRYTLVRADDGALLADKVEGILPIGPGLFRAVVDVDDPTRPAEILTIRTEGFPG